MADHVHIRKQTGQRSALEGGDFSLECECEVKESDSRPSTDTLGKRRPFAQGNLHSTCVTLLNPEIRPKPTELRRPRSVDCPRTVHFSGGALPGAQQHHVQIRNAANQFGKISPHLWHSLSEVIIECYNVGNPKILAKFVKRLVDSKPDPDKSAEGNTGTSVKENCHLEKFSVDCPTYSNQYHALSILRACSSTTGTDSIMTLDEV
ncbi:hypothetical protein M427DRAFT_43313 [Gonapodya prolifera JEL478]|uniref:Uncharacterized protein n=1 Tax=Gonapodya prolifera (strain JEL478) TaxID=1344416 RepID=A0A139AJV4_GONPJ|nr:hypothetical protein M427DRAFT_43313 [Gonapodya prolifera JEL478]|eukprot:KXS17067.1 hypothetical protein M427DRAFT_43313 [Gonapodya prolifera JEL478]